ncbi:unnamed protein product [Prorocentrum cordatum]|uniref:Uncharacterized protein n=1 Tax=Prorocentrum cordatum TaxID=2364126 RepID=A0ABN9W8A9_9DINO|nr:unnamed protein product [Polarella glacialis]
MDLQFPHWFEDDDAERPRWDMDKLTQSWRQRSRPSQEASNGQSIDEQFCGALDDWASQETSMNVGISLRSSCTSRPSDYLHVNLRIFVHGLKQQTRKQRPTIVPLLSRSARDLFGNSVDFDAAAGLGADASGLAPDAELALSQGTAAIEDMQAVRVPKGNGKLKCQAERVIHPLDTIDDSARIGVLGRDRPDLEAARKIQLWDDGLTRYAQNSTELAQGVARLEMRPEDSSLNTRLPKMELTQAQLAARASEGPESKKGRAGGARDQTQVHQRPAAHAAKAAAGLDLQGQRTQGALTTAALAPPDHPQLLVAQEGGRKFNEAKEAAKAAGNQNALQDLKWAHLQIWIALCPAATGDPKIPDEKWPSTSERQGSLLCPPRKPRQLRTTAVLLQGERPPTERWEEASTPGAAAEPGGAAPLEEAAALEEPATGQAAAAEEPAPGQAAAATRIQSVQRGKVARRQAAERRAAREREGAAAAAAAEPAEPEVAVAEGGPEQPAPTGAEGADPTEGAASGATAPAAEEGGADTAPPQGEEAGAGEVAAAGGGEAAGPAAAEPAAEGQ